MPSSFVKDPDATLDYKFDWSNWLTGSEIISSFALDVPSGLTLDSSSNDNTSVTAWISGGTVNTKYAVGCEITTNSSPARVDERSITIKVRQR
jgi:hypothetical protein